MVHTRSHKVDIIVGIVGQRHGRMAAAWDGFHIWLLVTKARLKLIREGRQAGGWVGRFEGGSGDPVIEGARLSVLAPRSPPVSPLRIPAESTLLLGIGCLRGAARFLEQQHLEVD